MTELSKVKQELLERKQEMLDRMQRTEENLQRRNKPLEKDFAEQATERENDEVLEALQHSSREELLDINRALDRIEEGSYNICASCGDEIPAKRLEAIPYTTHCVDCAEHLKS